MRNLLLLLLPLTQACSFIPLFVTLIEGDGEAGGYDTGVSTGPDDAWKLNLRSDRAEVVGVAWSTVDGHAIRDDGHVVVGMSSKVCEFDPALYTFTMDTDPEANFNEVIIGLDPWTGASIALGRGQIHAVDAQGGTTSTPAPGAVDATPGDDAPIVLTKGPDGCEVKLDDTSLPLSGCPPRGQWTVDAHAEVAWWTDTDGLAWRSDRAGTTAASDRAPAQVWDGDTGLLFTGAAEGGALHARVDGEALAWTAAVPGALVAVVVVPARDEVAALSVDDDESVVTLVRRGDGAATELLRVPGKLKHQSWSADGHRLALSGTGRLIHLAVDDAP